MNVLFLQGPLGSFFKNLATNFSKAGYNTHKINFNGGDRFYGHADTVTDFTGTPEEWPDFLAGYLSDNDISSVFLLGDCRLYHRLAKPVCRSMNVHFMVFEEGYLRPDTITLEAGGVNALSELDLSQEVIRNTSIPVKASAVSMGGSMKRRTVAAAFYYWSSWFQKKRFPHYQHHRAFNPVREGYCWLRGFARKRFYRSNDQLVRKQLLSKFSGQFVLVPLQVHDDSQKIYHSDYSSVEAFIEEVMTSFKEHASENRALCFKHHPMDIGYTQYSQHICELADRMGISDRVFYCHEAALPELYRHASSVITVNSTVGLSAILHKLPTLATGQALYDMQGLTHQGTMSAFWESPEPVDYDLFQHFHSYIYEKTQLNGSFFNKPEISCENARLFFEQIIGSDAQGSFTSACSVSGHSQSEEVTSSGLKAA